MLGHQDIRRVRLRLHEGEVIGLPICPRRFPVGAKSCGRGIRRREGNLRLIARYIVLPSSSRINVPADLSRAGIAAGPRFPPRLQFQAIPGQRLSESSSKNDSPLAPNCLTDLDG